MSDPKEFFAYRDFLYICTVMFSQFLRYGQVLCSGCNQPFERGDTVYLTIFGFYYRAHDHKLIGGILYSSGWSNDPLDFMTRALASLRARGAIL